MSEDGFDEGLEVLRENLTRIYGFSVSYEDARLTAAVVSMLISAGFVELGSAHNVLHHIQNVENMRHIIRRTRELRKRVVLREDYVI